MGYSLGLLSGPHDPSTQRVPVAPLPSPRTPTRRSRRSNRRKRCNVEAQIGAEGRARARIDLSITARVEFEGAHNRWVLAAVIGVHDDRCGKRMDRWIAVGVHGDISRSAHVKNKADTRA